MLSLPSRHPASLSRLALVLSFVALLAAACSSGESGGPSSSEAPSSPAAAPTATATSTATSPAGTSSAPPAPSSSADAAPPNPYAGGTPINVPANQWTYVPMNDFICGNGNPSGIAVNPASSPNAPLLVFFMGGGACWDAVTCLSGAASNINEDVGEANVMGDVPRVKALFDRTAAANPFKDASFVFIPYCTADLHAGDATKTYSLLTKSVTVHHNGSKNTDAVVKRLLATFASPSKVYVTGASGGGYGAMFGVPRFQKAYPGFRVDVLDDCGPPIDPAGSTWKDMQASWNLQIPSGCTGCSDDGSKILPYLATQMPNGRFALLDFTQDKTIRSFTGILVPQDFENKLMSLRSAAGPKQKTFFVSGDSHVLLKQDPLPTSANGLPLYTWLQRFASDDPSWAHEGP